MPDAAPPSPRRIPSARAGALIWLVGDSPARVLDLGSGPGRWAQSLLDAGHEVFCVDHDPRRVAALSARLGTRLHVAGQVESLPYLSCHFDVVTAAQNLHRFAPGLAFTEIARVLKPGGHLAVMFDTRDDTVPWVRRLMAILQQVDPDAMRGDYGDESVSAVADSPYFDTLERRNFRHWVPTTRAQLLTTAHRLPAVARLGDAERDALLTQVGALYDTSARAPDPLMLPYQTSCWRAVVDHTQLSISDSDDALQICF